MFQSIAGESGGQNRLWLAGLPYVFFLLLIASILVGIPCGHPWWRGWFAAADRADG